MRYLLAAYFPALFCLLSCGEPAPRYEGMPPCAAERPIRRTFAPDVFYSEGHALKTRIRSALQEEYANQDVVYPRGITITHYQDDGTLSFLLRAKEAYYHHREKKYTVRKEVYVKNFVKAQEMNTEELVWDVTKREIYTNFPVSIASEGEVHQGAGLRASEDFESYTLLAPTGAIRLDASAP